jgi:purine nucleosidase
MSDQQLVHIDTDMGVDDGLALVVAAKLKELRVVALSTVFGNVSVETASRNAAIFAHLLNLAAPLPIIRGAGTAADGFCCNAQHVHGEDGLGGVTAALDAELLGVAKQMRTFSLEDPPQISGDHRPLTLVGLGPATNLPRLIEWYSPRRITRVVLMTGVFFDDGNITKDAEFNAYCDPGALQATLDIGIPTTIISLDVTRKVQLSAATVESYCRIASPLMQLVARLHLKYSTFYRDWEGIDGCLPHDSVAVLAAARPDKFYAVRGTVSVDATEARGKTRLVPDDRSHIEIVTGGDLKWVRGFLEALGP